MLDTATNSLKRRLLITGFILLVLVLLASVSLFYTASKYNYNNERSSRAQHVYASYRAVSDHTYRKLSAIGEIVEEGTLINLHERFRNKEALRSALRDVRESIAAELTIVGDLSETEELEHFNKIELLAEEIIRGSELVRTAVESNRPQDAREALRTLRSHEVEGNFIRLIDDALSEELREVRETQLVVQELNTILTRLLSAIFICFILFGTWLLFTTWRALARTVAVFEKAAMAYEGGDFSYRVPETVEHEFNDLAKALNKMAAELNSQRERELTTQQNLESIIHERTRALQQSNNELERIGENRKQFLADISHELRTPLTIIQGEADVTLRGDPKTPEQYVSALARIKEQTIHITRFVQDLLFVARTESGKAPLHKRACDLVELVRGICEDFSILAEERQISIDAALPAKPIRVEIDDSKIKQALSILLDNALRYSFDNTTIRVEIEPYATQAVISVSDTGIGLKYNEASELFSRFYRGTDGAGKAPGTGLGLPVAKAIVESHQGKIELRGENGGGTTATLTLPLMLIDDSVQ